MLRVIATVSSTIENDVVPPATCPHICACYVLVSKSSFHAFQNQVQTLLSLLKVVVHQKSFNQIYREIFPEY